MEKREQDASAQALRAELIAYNQRIGDMLYVLEHHEELLTALRTRVAKLKEEIVTSKKRLVQKSLKLPRTDEQVQKALNYSSNVRQSLGKLREALDQRAMKTLSDTELAIKKRETALETLCSELDSL